MKNTSVSPQGILNEDGSLNSAESNYRLAEIAVAYAKAGKCCEWATSCNLLQLTSLMGLSELYNIVATTCLDTVMM